MLNPLWSRGRGPKARKVTMHQIKQMINLFGPSTERIREAFPWLTAVEFQDSLVRVREVRTSAQVT